MTAPTPGTITKGLNASSASSNSIANPGNLGTATRVIVIYAKDNNSTASTATSGWTKIGEIGASSSYDRLTIFEGLVSGVSWPLVVTHTSFPAAWTVIPVNGASTVSASVVATGSRTNSGTTVVVPAATPTWGVGDALSITVVQSALGTTSTIPTTAPASYTGKDSQSTNGSGGSVHTAYTWAFKSSTTNPAPAQTWTGASSGSFYTDAQILVRGTDVRTATGGITLGGTATAYVPGQPQYLETPSWFTPGTYVSTLGSYKDVVVPNAEAGDVIVAVGLGETWDSGVVSAVRSITTQAGSTGSWTMGSPTVILNSDADVVAGYATVTSTGSVTVRAQVRVSIAQRMGVGVWLIKAADVGSTFGWSGSGFVADTDGQYSVTLGTTSTVLYAAGDWSATNMAATTATPSGATYRHREGDGATYGVYLADWVDQTAGTRNYGPSGLSSKDFSGVVFAMDKAVSSYTVTATGGITLSGTVNQDTLGLPPQVSDGTFSLLSSATAIEAIDAGSVTHVKVFGLPEWIGQTVTVFAAKPGDLNSPVTGLVETQDAYINPTRWADRHADYTLVSGDTGKWVSIPLPVAMTMAAGTAGMVGMYMPVSTYTSTSGIFATDLTSRTGSFRALGTGSSVDPGDGGTGNGRYRGGSGSGYGNWPTTSASGDALNAVDLVYYSLGPTGIPRTATGGVTLSGTAAAVAQMVRTATGGLTLTGTATQSEREIVTATGGVSLSGAATAFVALTRTATGGVALSGSATAIEAEIVNATGTITLSGTAVQVNQQTRTASGGVTLAGGAAQVAQMVRTATGGVTLTGDAQQSNGVVRTATGAVTLSGTATAVAQVVRTATGGVTLSGATLTGIPVTAGARPNLSRDPMGTTVDWMRNEASVTVSPYVGSLAGMPGTTSVRAVASGTGNASMLSVGMHPGTVAIGQPYTMSAWIYNEGPNSGDFWIWARAWPESNQSVQSSIVTIPAGGAHRFSATIVPNGFSTELRLNIRRNSGDDGAVYYATGFEIYQDNERDITLSGTAPQVTQMVRTATGAITLGGTAAAFPAYARTASAGVTLSGAAPQAIQAVATATGGVTLSGTAAQAIQAARTATGGVTLSGTATTAIQAITAASGGVTLSGIAVQANQQARTGTGNLVLGGSAATVPVHILTATSGVVLAGIGDVAGGALARTSTGNLALTGSATAVAQMTVIAVAGVTLSGSAAQVNQQARTATGGVVLSGASTALAQVARTATGGIVLSGIGQTGTESVTRTATGGVVLTGSAPALVSFTRVATGGVTLGGAAAAEVRVDRTATGGVALTGTALVVTRLATTATGGIILTGAATSSVRHIRTATGTIVLSGFALVGSSLRWPQQPLLRSTTVEAVLAGRTPLGTLAGTSEGGKLVGRTPSQTLTGTAHENTLQGAS